MSQDDPNASSGAAHEEHAPGVVPVVPPAEASGTHQAGRYRIADALDDGLHVARDQLLDRQVLVRVADTAQADDLQRQARFLARLRHTGATPVLDFVRGDGGALLVLHDPEGVRLSEALAEARIGRPHPDLSSPLRVVLLMLRVGEVLVAAHARGVVHRGLLPVHITLGLHGQIIVGGWDAAMVAVASPLTRRYVSAEVPEQSQLLDDRHADLRALALCLFECLVLRPAVAQAGDLLGAVTAGERDRLHPALEAVIRKALHSGPANGYRDIAEMTRDLQDFAGGVQLDAYDPGLRARLEAWAYRSRRGLITGAALLLALGAAGLVGYETWLRYHERWGEPLVTETFSDGSWKERWSEAAPGSFTIKDGRLSSIAPREAVLIFRKRLKTPVAIEYTGRIAPGARPCDLSVWWSERSGVLDDPSRIEDGARLYMIQAGAYENSFCAIFQRPQLRRLAHADLRLESGRDYRFRVEISGEVMSMSIDGQRVLESRDLFPTTSGYLALYGYFPGKEFDDVSIYQKSLPRSVSPVAMGDSLFQYEHYDEAASIYARIAETDGGSAVGQQALYRKGLAEWRLGRKDASRRTWAELDDPALRELAECMQLDDLIDDWRLDELARRLEAYYHGRPALRAELRQQWSKLLTRIRVDPRRDAAGVRGYLDLRRCLFPDDGASAFDAATVAFEMGDYDAVLRDYPGEQRICADALLALGRTREVLEAPWTLAVERGRALAITGEFRKLLALPDVGSSLIARTMCTLDWAEEALRDTREPFPALIHLGRGEELLAIQPLPGLAANDALLVLGRLAEAAGDGVPGVANSGGDWRASVLLGRLDDAERQAYNPLPWARLLAAVEAGDAGAIARQRAAVRLPQDLGRASGWFAGVVIGPLIDQLRGEREALRRSLHGAIEAYPDSFGKRAWFTARAALGRCSDAELLAMPAAAEAQAWLALATALRAEVEGADAGALAAYYRHFLGIPPHRRLFDGSAPDVQIEAFVAWRLRQLAR